MRNPISLLAAALVCAAPALAGGFDRGAWLVIAAGSPNDHVVKDRVSRACPDGTLAAMKSDVDRETNKTRTYIGWGWDLPLYCVHRYADGTSKVDAVDAKVLEFRFYRETKWLASGQVHYYYNSGAESREVGVRAPQNGDFTAPTPASAQHPVSKEKPGAGSGSGNHRRTGSTNGSGSTHRSGSNAGVGGAVAKPAPAKISPAEKKWLTFPEKAAYETALKGHQGKTKSKLQLRLKDYRDARAKIAVNLTDREGGSKKYAGMTATDKVVAKEIDAYLNGLDAYGAKDPKEIKLDDGELAKLDAIKDSTNASQKANYAKEMGAADAKDVVLLHRIAAKYRAFIPAAKPEATSALTADEVEKLKGLKLYDDYQKDLAAAGGDQAKLAEVYKKYRDKIAAAPGQPRSLEELFRSRLTGDDLAAFNKDLAAAKTDAEKNAVYDKYLTRLGKISEDDLDHMPIEARKPFCDRLHANSKAGTAAAPAKTAKEQAQNIDVGKTDFDRGSKTMPLVTGRSSGGESLVASNENLRNAYAKCLSLEAQDLLPGGSKKEEKAGEKKEKTVPAPTHSSTEDNKGGTAEKPKDPNLFRNLAQGMTGGLFGLILGSFFGGPLVMAGFAVALGAGSYLLSQHFNPPPKKDKDGGS